MAKFCLTSILTITLLVSACAIKTLPIGIVQKGQINLKGVYLSKNTNYNCLDSIAQSVCFLYENGVILYVGTVCNSEIKNSFDTMNTPKFHKELNDQKGDATHWGTLKINEGDVEFEMYTPRANPKTVIKSGKILSDSSFLVTKFTNNYERGKVTVINELYLFKPLKFKVDSTNIFVR